MNIEQAELVGCELTNWCSERETVVAKHKVCVRLLQHSLIVFLQGFLQRFVGSIRILFKLHYIITKMKIFL